MKRIGLPGCLLIALIACNNTTPENKPVETGNGPAPEKEAQQPTPAENSVNVSGCYLRVIQRDTLAASLQQNGNKVTGRLSFDNYEKDASTGSVRGNVENGIVKLTYTFQSEGMESTMQVFLKTEGGDLIHGIGDMTPDAKYANEAGISYPQENRLSKIDCALLPAKFK